MALMLVLALVLAACGKDTGSGNAAGSTGTEQSVAQSMQSASGKEETASSGTTASESTASEKNAGEGSTTEEMQGNLAEGSGSFEESSSSAAEAGTEEGSGEEPFIEEASGGEAIQEIPSVYLYMAFDAIDDEETHDRLYYYQMECAKLTEEAEEFYPDLAETVNSYFTGTVADIDAMSEQMADDVRMMREETAADYEMPASCDESELYIRRADAQVLSFQEEFYAYYGGVHGMYGYTGINFDTQTGAIINFDDVIADRDALMPVLARKLRENYPDTYSFSYYEDDDLAGMLAEHYGSASEEPVDINFVLDPQGVTFFFNPYEIGSYAEGAFQATILFEEAPDLFKETYGPSEEGFVMYFSDGQELQFDADADGVLDTVSVSPITPEGYYSGDEEIDSSREPFYTEIDVLLNDKTLRMPTFNLTFIRHQNMLLHRANGQNFVYIYAETDSGDFVEIFDLAAEPKPEMEEDPSISDSFVEIADAGIPVREIYLPEYDWETYMEMPPVDPEYPQFDFFPNWMVALGALSVTNLFRLMPDGQILPLMNEYTVPDYTVNPPIRTMIEMQAIEQDPDGTFHDVTLPEDTWMWFEDTDYSGWAGFQTDENAYVRIAIEIPEFGIMDAMYDGKPISDCFEVVDY